MNRSIKVGAAVGALVLAGSLAFGPVSPVFAADPTVTITNAAADGTVPGDEAQLRISGCSKADGYDYISVYLFSHELGDWVGQWPDPARYQQEAPDTGNVELTLYTDLPGAHGADVQCADYSGTIKSLSADFVAATGVVMLAGPNGANSWLSSDPVTLTSPVYETPAGDFARAFDPNSQVNIQVTGPDGQVYELGSYQADGNGTLSVTMVLPYNIRGNYTIHLTGTLNTAGQSQPRLLVGGYQSAGEPPASPSPSPSATSKSSAKPANKPTALPRTGGDGLGLVSAAAVVSVVAGGALLAIRSRKN